jgi:hypothetical protein
MASILTQLVQQKSASQIQSYSSESYRWLLKKINELRNTKAIPVGVSREEARKVNRFLLGQLYCFYYDPKMKDDLPYYDKFPLVLVLERYPDGFLGLNLHYLPIKYRIAFLDKLLDYASFNQEDEIKRIRITYDILNASRKFREFKPCLKRYLTSHIKSKMLAIQPKEWEVAIFLPMHQFKGAKPKEVWQESVDQIRNS